jgi:O-antigen/teichoic acid export membrane protein
MSSGEKIVSGVIWSTLVNIVNAIYGFISVPILISYFGKSEYGLIGLAMSVNVYMNLMDLGFNSTNVRFFSIWLTQRNHQRLATGFQTSLAFYGIVGLLNAIILLAIAFCSNSIFNVSVEQDVILKELLYILAVSALCSWFSSCFEQLIKATENIAWIQQRLLLTKILMLIVLFGTIYYKMSIGIYFLLTTLAQLSIIPLSIQKIRCDLPYIKFLPIWDKEAFKEILPYSVNVFSFGLFQFSFYNLRPIFLGIQGTVESVADYRILNGIVGIVTLLGGAFIGILLPSTSKAIANKDENAFYRMAYDGTKYISVLCCFFCFGMMSIATEVLTLYVGSSYLYLIPWFNLWLICTLSTHNQAISSLILAGDDIRAISYSSFIASVIGLLIAWFSIPYFKIGGVCIAFLVYGIIQLSFYYFYYWPYKMRINSKKVFTYSFFPYCISGVLAYLITISIPVYTNTFIALVLKGLLFTFLYAIMVYSIFNRSDRDFILKLLFRR